MFNAAWGDSGSPVFDAGGWGATFDEADADAGMHGILWGGPPDNFNETWVSPVNGVQLDVDIDLAVCDGGLPCRRTFP